MSPTRLVTLLAATAALALTGACGGNKAEPGTGALGTTDPTPTTTVPTPTPTPTATPKPSKPATTSAGPDDGGDGDAEGKGAPAVAGGGICRYVGAEEVGAVLGVAVTGSAIPGQTGCEFDQGGQHGTSVTLVDKSAAEAGGMDGAKSEATSAVEGEPQDLSGIGSAAFVVTGTMFGGSDVQAAGAVQIGNRIVSVLLEQHSAIAGSRMRTLETDLLKLVVHESP
jgi:hypothetical protein